MYKHRSREKNQDVQINWEFILREAEEALSEAKTRVRQLRSAVRTIKMRIEGGKPFPTGHAKTSTQT